MGEKRYDYNEAAALLIPEHKICIINFDEVQETAFLDYCEDFIEDLGFLSEKYEYRNEIGRPRKWKNELILELNASSIESIEELEAMLRIQDKNNQRKADFLISLLIGSINDIKTIGTDAPDSLLDQIKKKIVLFDGEQSLFVYSDKKRDENKRITIQGLAGTGKTELLLHKLKELYTNDKECKIVFTCFNYILAKNMRKRVPEFFNFMKVDEQIEWEKRLWVIRSWGSGNDPNSGVYRMICDHYNIPFRSYSYNWNFDKVCTDALEQLEEIGPIEPFLDYVLIDESQDFSESFFRLCEKVTKKNIYIAGDIFQNIYDIGLEDSVKSDYLLNRCYRTDPRTLMLSHAIGMGLYEKPIIRWLSKEEWQLCGYEYEDNEGCCTLKRVPIRRFEDSIDKEIENARLIATGGNIIKTIIDIINDIIKEHNTVQPDDIAIVFVGENKEIYETADALVIAIKKEFGWKAIKGYEIKDKIEKAIFISNKNNIKGLEFPFVICIENEKITDDIFQRNTLYMALTRSFIASYFIINNNLLVDNSAFIETYKGAARQIQENNQMILRKPDVNEVKEQNNRIRIMAKKGVPLKRLSTKY